MLKIFVYKVDILIPRALPCRFVRSSCRFLIVDYILVFFTRIFFRSASTVINLTLNYENLFLIF